MKLKTNERYDLFYFKDGKWIEVNLKACFPNSIKNHFLSIQDKDGKEIILIENSEHLDKDNRDTIHDYLKFKHFIYHVVGVFGIEEDFGLRNYEVETLVGNKKFQTELDEWPRRTESGAIEIRDLYGDTFSFKKLNFGSELFIPFLD